MAAIAGHTFEIERHAKLMAKTTRKNTKQAAKIKIRLL